MFLLLIDHRIKSPDSISTPRVLLNTMASRPPDPAKVDTRASSAELHYDYGMALSVQLDEYDYFR